MKAGIISLIILVLCSILIPSATASAQERTEAPSASFAAILRAQKEDNRVSVLKQYLENHNSPMVDNAEDFVIQADINHIPWDLVAAIAGTESTFGQHEPSNCYNGWGYGIYGDNVLCFNSYTEAIKTISRALRDTYIDKFGARDVYGIGKYYASSPTWGMHTDYFMKDIESFQKSYESSSLPISL